jgi:hypothetical protein
MASKGTNKTIVAVGLVAIVGYLAYKSLPTLLHKLKGSKGATGAAGAPAPNYYNPYQQQQQTPGQPKPMDLKAMLDALRGTGNTSSPLKEDTSGLNQMIAQSEAANAVQPLALNEGQADADFASQVNAESDQTMADAFADKGPTDLLSIAEANSGIAPGTYQFAENNSTPSGSILGSDQVPELEQAQFLQADSGDASASGAEGISLPDQDLPDTSGYDDAGDSDSTGYDADYGANDDSDLSAEDQSYENQEMEDLYD